MSRPGLHYQYRHRVHNQVVEPNLTTSSLSLKPSPADQDVVITCRVENPAIPGSVMEESYKLNVHYPPITTLRVGLRLNPGSVREGSDVFFECSIQANPHTTSMFFLHMNETIRHNVSARVIVSNQTLVLQSVSRQQTGPYRCGARNAVGLGVSEPVLLRVLYAPVCAPGQKVDYEVLRYRTANVSCTVDAQPNNVTFTWLYNNTGTLLDVGEGRSTSHNNVSILHYTPTSPSDYGTLLCSAKNVIGEQQEPCVISVTASKLPELVSDCRLRAQTSTAVIVTCVSLPSELPTAYYMEVRHFEELQFVKRVSNSTPYFVADGLAPGTDYTLHVSVVSPMGNSTPIELQAFTIKTAEKRMELSEATNPAMASPSSPSPSVSPLVMVSIIVVVAMLVLSTIVVMAVIRCHHKRRAQRLREETETIATAGSRSSGGSQYSPTSVHYTGTLLAQQQQHVQQKQQQTDQELQHRQSASMQPIPNEETMQIKPENTMGQHQLSSMLPLNHPQMYKKFMKIEECSALGQLRHSPLQGEDFLQRHLVQKELCDHYRQQQHHHQQHQLQQYKSENYQKLQHERPIDAAAAAQAVCGLTDKQVPPCTAEAGSREYHLEELRVSLASIDGQHNFSSQIPKQNFPPQFQMWPSSLDASTVPIVAPIFSSSNSSLLPYQSSFDQHTLPRLRHQLQKTSQPMKDQTQRRSRTPPPYLSMTTQGPFGSTASESGSLQIPSPTPTYTPPEAFMEGTSCQNSVRERSACNQADNWVSSSNGSKSEAFDASMLPDHLPSVQVNPGDPLNRSTMPYVSPIEKINHGDTLNRSTVPRVSPIKDIQISTSALAGKYKSSTPMSKSDATKPHDELKSSASSDPSEGSPHGSVDTISGMNSTTGRYLTASKSCNHPSEPLHCEDSVHVPQKHHHHHHHSRHQEPPQPKYPKIQHQPHSMCEQSQENVSNLISQESKVSNNLPVNNIMCHCQSQSDVEDKRRNKKLFSQNPDRTSASESSV
ncbi:uncharacterized protein LOC108680637 [Hyalella azteca]|uniref:Uncharacterized protein LOC108680637 n=1 Tax=Hyalella azteca TaxID=294128 RepID=A0A979FNS5_HYAAZ|nr:uncharacterized protein LOC108680637 [Hyalella azteca]